MIGSIPNNSVGQNSEKIKPLQCKKFNAETVMPSLNHFNLQIKYFINGYITCSYHHRATKNKKVKKIERKGTDRRGDKAAGRVVLRRLLYVPLVIQTPYIHRASVKKKIFTIESPKSTFKHQNARQSFNVLT